MVLVSGIISSGQTFWTTLKLWSETNARANVSLVYNFLLLHPLQYKVGEYPLWLSQHCDIFKKFKGALCKNFSLKHLKVN